MNCIVIDDEEMARAIIGQMIIKHPVLNFIEEFQNAVEALKFLNQSTTLVDVIFLDIHMPGFTGFDFIQTIKNPPLVILITSDRNFAIEAFEYKCIVDYLVKPITEERFLKAINKIEAKKHTLPSYTETSDAQPVLPNDTATEFYINIDRRLIKINMASINVIEAKGDYILIKTEDKNYTVHSTLKKIEDKLPTSSFLKVHRTYIINIKKIIDIEDNSVLIAKDVIPVSRSNRPELMKRLNML
ncbi:LytTR family DNA-binding domain-containing protein [Flavobacterium sp. 5]|uniref:LytR/AlgR family response regulator transcription factor n=1 Tax=Flavobacterium sp. 5 TaxID=2035199 RepID=UPI000C2C2EEC|nr:LytTR family DNA-binding domain-containing protein [Flavobacterium sp. 5]PKB15912.1 LytTR family two component transcriptional regulator [Flavobacterium sp. 5]